jgi:hypothetical protein
MGETSPGFENSKIAGLRKCVSAVFSKMNSSFELAVSKIIYKSINYCD